MIVHACRRLPALEKTIPQRMNPHSFKRMPDNKIIVLMPGVPQPSRLWQVCRLHGMTH